MFKPLLVGALFLATVWQVEGKTCLGQDGGCCTPETPCKENEGDCDSDEECEGDLFCGVDNCPRTGHLWDAGDDCCVKRGAKSPGWRMNVGSKIYSDSRRCYIELQTDGNLVLYREHDRKAFWASGTHGDIPNVQFQSDGNLVMYDKGGSPLWSSGTHNKGAQRLILQDDGNFVMYDGDGKAVWSTRTSGKGACRDFDTTANWMKRIPDNTPLTQLSIPGTHDSMAYEGNVGVPVYKWIAECQGNDLKTQLNNGIRYIDVRLKLKGKDKLRGYHGIAWLNTWLDDVLNTLVDFLAKNPSETVMMEYQWEGVSRGETEKRQELKKVFQQYVENVPTNYRYFENRVPNLGDVRGKIIFYDMDGSGYGLGRVPGDQEENTWSLEHVCTDESGEKVKDSYIDSLKAHIKVAAENKDPKKLFLTYLPGNCLKETDFIRPIMAYGILGTYGKILVGEKIRKQWGSPKKYCRTSKSSNGTFHSRSG